MSLIHEVKQRQHKRAVYEAGLRAASELGEEAIDRAVVTRELTPDRIPAMHVRPIAESRVSDYVAELVKNKKIRPRDAAKTSKTIMDQLEPEIQKQEALAFRTESGERAQAPSTILGTLGGLGVATALPWAFTRGSWLWGKKPESPMTLGNAFKFNFLPSVLPWTAGIEGISHLIAPFSDPLKRSGNRGYWKSVGESFRGAQESLAERGAEARERYGIAGIPMQMLHGVFNPLASLSYLGKQVGGAFQKPDIEAWAQEAAERRRRMYGQS